MEVHGLNGPIPSWLQLGPVELLDGVSVRRVLGDWSKHQRCDRPPDYIVDGPVVPRTSIFDKSEARADVEVKLPGKNIRELRGIHSGKVAILFNGASMAQHDLWKIKCPIIGMNRTHQGWKGYNGPQPDYLCVIDHVWFDDPKLRSGVLKHPKVINGSTHKSEVGYRVARSGRMAPFSFDLGRDGFVPPIPCTTGHLALQLAVYLGFTDLYCLGWDMGGRHFDGTSASLHFAQAAFYHKSQAPLLKEKGIRVTVCGSPDSKLKVFAHSSFEECCE